MQHFPVLGPDDDRLLKQVMGQYDVPAYVRRARRVQEAFDDLVDSCRGKRAEWLGMVRLRLGALHALAGDWAALRPYLADNLQCEILAEMHRQLAPRLRSPVDTTTSRRLLRRALHELRDSLERFNRRWREFLTHLDLSSVNEAREGYNRYYVLEKECAVRSAVAARQGFVPLESVTLVEFWQLLPELPVPKTVDRPGVRFPSEPGA